MWRKQAEPPKTWQHPCNQGPKNGTPRHHNHHLWHRHSSYDVGPTDGELYLLLDIPSYIAHSEQVESPRISS